MAAAYLHVCFIELGIGHCVGTYQEVTRPLPAACPSLAGETAELVEPGNAVPAARAGRLGIAHGLTFCAEGWSPRTMPACT